MSDKQPNNLELWNSVCQTDPKHTKKANNGKYDFTAVDPQHQLQKATELFGPYGKAWGLKECHFRHHSVGEKEALILDAVFYYPDGEFEVYADMPYRWNDDAYKKITTLARSKALSTLGFNADVYLGQYDDEHYVKDMQAKYADEDQLRKMIFSAIRKASTAAILQSSRDRLDELRGNGAINKPLYDEGLQLISEQEKQLSNGAPPLDEQDAIRQQEIEA